jgi:hypothetical protein
MDCLSESSGQSIRTNENCFIVLGSEVNNADYNDNDYDNNSVYESPPNADMVFDPAKGIADPDPNDVICGRGKMTSLHPANRRFRELVNQHKDAYQRAKRREEKTRITYDLVDKLRSDGRYGHEMLLGISFKTLCCIMQHCGFLPVCTNAIAHHSSRFDSEKIYLVRSENSTMV